MRHLTPDPAHREPGPRPRRRTLALGLMAWDRSPVLALLRRFVTRRRPVLLDAQVARMWLDGRPVSAVGHLRLGPDGGPEMAIALISAWVSDDEAARHKFDWEATPKPPAEDLQELAGVVAGSEVAA